MSTSRVIRVVEVQVDELHDMLDRATRSPLSKADSEVLKDLVQSYAHLTEMLDDRSTTIARLRAILGSSKSEKTKNVLRDDREGVGADDAESKERAEEEPKKRKGHGRNGAKDYRGAERIKVAHESLRSGDQCPTCENGKVYAVKTPGVIVRVTGQAPLQATVYELEKLRCNLCGKVFTAQTPHGIGEKKYDARSASMIALLKYGSGLPFNRLHGLQGNLGIPLPPSTQWDLVEESANQLDPVYRELIRQAAQGEILHNDDTSMKILSFMAERREQEEAGENADGRTGVFTSGIVSTAAGLRIALFFTGRRHAGENLADVLAERSAELGAPIQMCDALSRNTSAAFETIVANCLAHGRRRFVDVVESFPEECRHVLTALGAVYKNEATTRKEDMSSEDRLRFHQTQSGPVMEQLHEWMEGQIDERKVERNSGLGQAIGYMLNHWEKLTLFLRTPGAPLDNNLCERALKKVILHRKNSLFYRTENGARVGDLFMSLIGTCQLVDANAFDYLTGLQEHPDDVARDPAAWMPWNYRDAIAAAKLN